MKPYISFVVVGRNDDYGHRFLYRFQNFIDNLTYLCNKYRLDSELIIVDWNPPKDKNNLIKELNFRKEGCLKIRSIEVPPQTHNTLEKSDKFPLFEYIGKNVGIQRAKGDFILSTNPDIIFNEELIKFLSKKKLSKNKFYRINRFGMKDDIPEKLNPEEIIKYCKRHYGELLGINFDWINPFNDPKRFLKTYPKWFVKSLIKIWKIIFEGKKHFWCIGGAPGDFSLMSIENWKSIKGNLEIPMHGWIDAYLVVQTITNGIEFEKLKDPLRIYHQTHGYQAHKERISLNEESKKLEKYMDKIMKKNIKNKEGWGLKKDKLKEVCI